MKTYEVLDLSVAFLNFVVLGVLTYRMTRSNEALTDLQKKYSESQQPRLKIWFRNISDKNKEFTLINNGGGTVFISYLTVKVSGQSCDWILPPPGAMVTTNDKFSLSNIAIKSGSMMKFEFGHEGHSGHYGGDLIMNNLKNECSSTYFNMSNPGPYAPKSEDFFFY